MLRDLVSDVLPMASWAMVYYPAQQRVGKIFTVSGEIYSASVFQAVPACVLAVHLTQPKSSKAYPSVPSMLAGMFETADFSMFMILLPILLTNHMSCVINYHFAAQSFFHVGAMVGSVFFTVIAQKLNRKISLLISYVMSIIVLIVLFIMTQALLIHRLTHLDRDYLLHGSEGNRKMRKYTDPNIAKAVGGEVGFGGAMPLDFQRIVLVCVFLGFTLSILSVTQTILVDLWGSASNSAESSRNAQCLLGEVYWHIGLFAGASAANLYYVLVDIDGSLMIMLVFRALRMIYFAFLPDSKAFAEEDATKDANTCWLKAMYGGLFLWPQGSRYVVDSVGYMFASCQAYKISSWAHLLSSRPRSQRLFMYVLLLALTKFIYMPTIGLMFWLNLFVTNPLNYSLYMELINQHFQIEASENIYMWHSLYPAFVSENLMLPGTAVFLGVCDAMRHLGSFLALSTWPTVLFCGDPMKCWRSQYLYSHAGFQDTGGNQGNISYIVWYCFCKSQKRQCCCPYRKLKPDAPQKCCPPCCLGPLVEESGGCPCPCCCASCSA